MSNGIKFLILLSAILIVMFSMAFAQEAPFQAEVTAQTARMRWGPGSSFAVQHYANAGHVLTVLEADAESDPPWTWYYARTPSGVQSWIRGDLIRRTDAVVPIDARPNNPTGAYPVLDNNLCNTSIFRACQDGADHGLWEAGYWAYDRYHHWESGGWNLDIVYHQNLCKTETVCTTREQWDAGRIEAELRVASATPEATVTPVVVKQTVEVGVREVWQTLAPGTSYSLQDNTISFYSPLLELKQGGAEGGTIIGGFRFNSESVSVKCRYWHTADQPSNDPVKSGDFGIGSFNDPNRVNCISGNIQEGNVTRREWDITLNRSYSGLGRITSVSWSVSARIEATGPGSSQMDGVLRTYLEAVRTDATKRDLTNTGNPYGIEELVANLQNSTCEGSSTTKGESPREVTRYEFICDDKNVDTGVGSTLTFKFTHDKTRGFLKPTTIPAS